MALTIGHQDIAEREVSRRRHLSVLRTLARDQQQRLTTSLGSGVIPGMPLLPNTSTSMPWAAPPEVRTAQCCIVLFLSFPARMELVLVT